MHSRPYFVDWALEHLLYCIVLYTILVPYAQYFHSLICCKIQSKTVPSIISIRTNVSFISGKTAHTTTTKKQTNEQADRRTNMQKQTQAKHNAN